METGEHLEGFVPAVLGCQPAWAVGKEEQADEEDESWDCLDAPGDAKLEVLLARMVPDITFWADQKMEEKTQLDLPPPLADSDPSTLRQCPLPPQTG